MTLSSQKMVTLLSTFVKLNLFNGNQLILVFSCTDQISNKLIETKYQLHVQAKIIIFPLPLILIQNLLNTKTFLFKLKQSLTD